MPSVRIIARPSGCTSTSLPVKSVSRADGVQAGWDLLDRLQGEAGTRGIPVIVTSTDPKLLDRADADAARSVSQRLVAKPFDIDALLGAVEELIGGAEPDAQPEGAT